MSALKVNPRLMQKLHHSKIVIPGKSTELFGLVEGFLCWISKCYTPMWLEIAGLNCLKAVGLLCDLKSSTSYTTIK